MNNEEVPIYSTKEVELLLKEYLNIEKPDNPDDMNRQKNHYLEKVTSLFNHLNEEFKYAAIEQNLQYVIFFYENYY